MLLSNPVRDDAPICFRKKKTSLHQITVHLTSFFLQLAKTSIQPDSIGLVKKSRSTAVNIVTSHPHSSPAVSHTTTLSTMSRLLGATLPAKKTLWTALTRIYGIGRTRAHALCFAIGATPFTKAAELRPFHLTQLYSLIEARYTVGNDLRANVRASIQRLIRIRSFRGLRHVQRLPVRGQRTHSNARTQKKMRPPPTV